MRDRKRGVHNVPFQVEEEESYFVGVPQARSNLALKFRVLIHFLHAHLFPAA